MPTTCRGAQRRLAAALDRHHVGRAGEQQPHERQVPDGAARKERCRAIVARAVDGGTHREQQSCDLKFAVRCRDAERREPVAIPRADLRTACEQDLHDARTPMLARHVERSLLGAGQ